MVWPDGISTSASKSLGCRRGGLAWEELPDEDPQTNGHWPTCGEATAVQPPFN